MWIQVYSLQTFSALTTQVGHMIQAESDNAKRDEYLKRLMSLPNQVSCFVFSHAHWLYLWIVLNMILTWLPFGLLIYRNGQK